MSLCAKSLWHRWGKWEQKETAYKTDQKIYNENTKEQMAVYLNIRAERWQERTCESCGLTVQKDLKASPKGIGYY